MDGLQPKTTSRRIEVQSIGYVQSRTAVSNSLLSRGAS